MRVVTNRPRRDAVPDRIASEDASRVRNVRLKNGVKVCIRKRTPKSWACGVRGICRDVYVIWVAMASAFSHAVAALSLGSMIRWNRPPFKYWFAGALCAAAPDFDSIGFAFGIRYGDVLGHRGFTHSLLFAMLFGAVVTGLGFRAEIRAGRGFRVCAFLILATASHGLLDAITNGGLGVAFFSPFDTTRYFFSLRPVEVSPINVARFFQGRGLRVMASELLWIWVPALLVAGITEAIRFGAAVRQKSRVTSSAAGSA